MSHQKKLEVCFTPALLSQYHLEDSIVVVIDIFRATSSICYGIHNGALEIIPVSTIEKCLEFKGEDYLLAAERDGEVVNGFDFGNSPFSYTSEKVKGKKIVLTTTNGTHAIDQSKNAHAILIGSFLNLDAICKYLGKQEKNVLLLCAGWKNKFNLEDTLFAGAVVHQIRSAYSSVCDASIAAEDLYLFAKEDMRKFLKKSSHTKRLERLHIEDDIVFCLQQNLTDVIPVFNKNKIIGMR